MKKMLIAELVLLASVLLSACSQSAPKPILETPIPTNETGIQEPANATEIQEPAKQGISSGNFLNKGYLVQSEGDPYYYYACNRRTQDGKNGIYRVHSETGESIRLSEHTASYLNLYDGYLYYRNDGDLESESIVWRVKCDGCGSPEEYYRTNYNITGGIMIADDTLYVVNTEGLCAASMGGKDSLTDDDMIIAAKGGNSPAVTSDRLYYLRKGGVSSSYLSKPLTDFETDAKVVLQNQHISQCMMGYGYVYYVDDTNYTDYYRACLTDGKIEKLLTLDGSSVIHVNLYKEHLYYMQDEYIWRCDLNGDNAEKVQEKPWREALTEEEKQSFLWYLYVANDTIYIFNSDLGRVVYEIKL